VAITPFDQSDIAFARALYEANPTPLASEILDLLMDNPGERFDSEVIQRRFSVEDHADIARTTYKLGVLAGAMNKSRPWSEAQRGFAMSPEVARVFREARAEALASR
jgi:Family of unknown function (DUF6416)